MTVEEGTCGRCGAAVPPNREPLGAMGWYGGYLYAWTERGPALVAVRCPPCREAEEPGV